MMSQNYTIISSLQSNYTIIFKKSDYFSCHSSSGTQQMMEKQDTCFSEKEENLM